MRGRRTVTIAMTGLGTMTRARRLQLGLSLRETAERAKERGHTLSIMAIQDIETGRTKRSCPRILRGLSVALDFPYEFLVLAAYDGDRESPAVPAGAAGE